MKGFGLLFFCLSVCGVATFADRKEKADLEKTLQQIAETSSDFSRQQSGKASETPVSGGPDLSAAQVSASQAKLAVAQPASAPQEGAVDSEQSSTTTPSVVMPENPKAFMEMGDRSEIALSFPQENTDTLILKVNNGMVLVRQKGKEFKIQIVGKDLAKTNVKAFKSRNGKALIVDSTFAASAIKKQRLDYLITIPQDVNLQFMSGKLDIKLENLKGTYVTLDCGQLIFRSVGGALSGFKATAGEANIWIDGILNQFLLACASGNIQVKYLSPSQSPVEGLSFARKPMISVRQALGRAVFVFPEAMKVMYKSSAGVRSSFPSERNADLRCVFYVSDLVDIQLVKEPALPN